MAALWHMTNWCCHACQYTGQVQQAPIVIVDLSGDHTYGWAGVELYSINYHHVLCAMV